MKIFVFSALGALVGVLLFVWLVGRVRYRIGSRHVKVYLLGIRLRRVAIANIESASKRRGEGWAEHWWSTFRPKHRVLVLRRKRGLFRNFVITPKNRYVFKTDLERAIQRVSNAAPPSVKDEDESDRKPSESDAGLTSADSASDGARLIKEKS